MAQRSSCHFLVKEGSWELNFLALSLRNLVFGIQHVKSGKMNLVAVIWGCSACMEDNHKNVGHYPLIFPKFNDVLSDCTT